VRCRALPLLRTTEDEVRVPSEEAEPLSPNAEGSPGASGLSPRRGSPPVLRARGGGRSGGSIHRRRFLGSAMLGEEQLGEGVTPGAGNAGPDSHHDPARGSKKPLPKGPPFRPWAHCP